ncbi:hypothetical protein ACIG3E_08430 [Streptomyces sp. NPDC053474]|uniref:hypothetical protein n=1 Tax=Streptomyces sp. NPDC053474 TaxID=3365704 RepID=UPI0037D61561
MSADVEALICELRRQHPQHGARRIAHELDRRSPGSAPSRATVHRVLSCNGLIRRQEQRHPRKYRRWQREAPMHLWQLDLVGGVPLADGRSCKLVTGIDDHSRFVVIASVVAVPSGRAVCSASSPAAWNSTFVFGAPTTIASTSPAPAEDSTAQKPSPNSTH